uniref:Uncharacterized protein n=1 Tax=Tanacetum cinerariifolium TaxID=118510 RepID=A0A699QJ56_TANCI|nr:hypothetical protein [Tanacetum cinerariifolium]
MCPSTHADTVCKSKRSSTNDKGKGKAIEVESESEDEDSSEEESYEIEQELAGIKRLLELAEKARKLDGKLPDSQKEKNSHLNDLRNDPHVKKFFDEEVPDIEDLNELEDALLDAKEEKQKELAEAEYYANTQPPSKTEPSNSSQHSSSSQ